MTSVVRYLIPVLLAAFLAFFQTDQAAAFDEPMLTIGTGNVSGVYYAAGSAVAKMHNIKRKEYGVRLITEASEGSIANIERVIGGSVEFGIAQANKLYAAWHGERFWKDESQTNLRAILGLHTEDFTIIAAADKEINTFGDLKGKRVNIGEFGSSDAHQAMDKFKFFNLDPEKDLKVIRKPNYKSSELIQEGKIDAYFYTVGHPNLSIREVSSGKRPIVIVSPGREMIDRYLSVGPYFVATEIGIDKYPNIVNREPIPTFGVKAILFTSKDTDEIVVYNMVKEVFANFDLFKRQHLDFVKLTPEKMSSGLIVPLHPGAERYFREAGLLP